MTEFSSCDIDCMAHKAENNYYLAFYWKVCQPLSSGVIIFVIKASSRSYVHIVACEMMKERTWRSNI